MRLELVLFLVFLNGFYSAKTFANDLTKEPVTQTNQSYLGNSSLPIWSHLTEFEMTTVNQLVKAKSGDADSLLMLYLVASGNSRTFAQYNLQLAEITDFIRILSPQLLNESSEWRKGFLLLQAMHEHFFLGGKSDSKRGYLVEQSQLSQIIKSGEFNCISSSMLFTILARKLELDVQGVLLPSHAFVQLRLSSGKTLDIETTSIKGYDWLHDEAFYQKTDRQWFEDRGLSPSTFEQYKSRKIVSPLMLGVDNMTHQHTAKSRMNDESRSRIAELLSILDVSNIDAHKARLYFYNNEFVRLNDTKEYSELNRMYERINPFLSSMGKYQQQDIELANMLGWVGSQKAFVATKMQQNEQALAIARKTITSLNDSVKDKEKIISNIFTTLNLVSQSYTNQQAFKKSLAVYQGKHAQCMVAEKCNAALAYLYSKWASSFWDKKQWSEAIKLYSDYLSFETSGEAVEMFRSNMQSAHINWANSFYKTGDWLQVKKILTQCIDSEGLTDLCQNNLTELVNSHQLE